MNDTMTINGEKYRKVNADSPVKIAILQRGWVMVGRFEREGNDCTLTDAAVVRIWGTTRGLGEIAQNGPTGKTSLDKCGVVHFHYLTVVALLDCEESKWLSTL